MTRALALVAVAATLAAGTPSVAVTRRPALRCDQTVPTIRAVGAVASNAAAISPGLPSGTVAGDLLLMFCENSGEGAQTASGWTEVVAASTTGTRLTVLMRVSANGADATTTNDVGDHQLCRIIGITQGKTCALGIVDVSTTNTQTATGSVSITGINTTVNNTLVFQASAGDLPDATGTTQFSSAANANLGSVTERIDNTVTAGNGGALFVMSGTLATAGATGTGTVTASTTTAVRANATFAIRGRT